jgi:hypothetical protein
MKGIARGIYGYKLERAGYKSFDSSTSNPPGFLDLVDWKLNEKGYPALLCQRNRSSPLFLATFNDTGFTEVGRPRGGS